VIGRVHSTGLLCQCGRFFRPLSTATGCLRRSRPAINLAVRNDRKGSGTVIGCGGWYEGHASAKRSRRVIAQPLGDTINHAAQCLAIGRLIPVFSRAPDWALLWPDQASRPGGRDWEPIASFRSRWPAGPLSRGPYIENWLSIVLFQLSTKAAASWTAASNSLSLFTRVAIPSRTGWAIPEGR